MDGKICTSMESWIIIEDDTIFHDALIYAIVFGIDKAENGDATAVNRMHVVTTEGSGIESIKTT